MASVLPLKVKERTTGTLPPIELRLFIAQVGRGAPSSKSISISLRELANAGNVIAVLRSFVSMTSPESPTNTYRPSRLWCNHPSLRQSYAQGLSLPDTVPTNWISATCLGADPEAPLHRIHARNYEPNPLSKSLFHRETRKFHDWEQKPPSR